MMYIFAFVCGALLFMSGIAVVLHNALSTAIVGGVVGAIMLAILAMESSK